MITTLQLVGGFVLLLFGAEYLVRGAVSIALKLKVSPMVIGMTIVAWGTTSPEIVVSVESALDGFPGIAVGNVIGSNIANILLILGTSAIIFPIVVKPKLLVRDASMMMGSALLLTTLALSGSIERWQGVLMVFALFAFSAYALQQERKKGKKDDPGDLAEELTGEFKSPAQPTWLAVVSVIGGLVSVVSGAKFLVAAAVDIARIFDVGEEVIGLTIVAVGTSLPEYATATVAALRRHSDIAVGNIMGANIYNLLAILGLVSVVTPVAIPAQILAFDLWFMLAVTALLLFFLLVRSGVDRFAGVLFLALFVGYTVLQFYGVDKVLT